MKQPKKPVPRKLRATQIGELERVLRQRTIWKEIVTPVFERAVARKSRQFLRSLTAFIKDGGRVPNEIRLKWLHLALVSRKGHFSPVVMGALSVITWEGEEMTRERLQTLIDTPEETGMHFTYFLAEWGEKNM